MSVRELPRQVVRRLRSSRRAGPVSFPFLIVLSGLPGVGKSTLARGLSRRLGATIVESDAVRLSLSPTPTFSAAESKRVFGLCHARAARLLGKGVPVILDATSLKNAHRLVPLRIAEQAGVPALIVAVETPTGVVRERLERRGEEAGSSQADWSVYLRMRNERECIQQPHVVVDGSGDASQAIEEIVAAVERSVQGGNP